MNISSKILVVDDDNIVTNALKTLFRVEGISNAEFLNSPCEALEFIKLQTPDLIISDFLMPKMDGIQFLTEAKKICPNSSMILLTGYADKENAIKAINEVGIYKYIEKPWDNDDLIMNIRNAVERTNLISQLNIKVQELETAKNQLEKYSHSLEEIVFQRTKDLIQSNNKLSAIINYCADGIVIFSPEGVVELVNPAFENMIGLSQSMLLGKSVFDVIRADVLTFDKFSLSKDKEVFLRDFSVQNAANGRLLPVEISLSPIFNDGDEDVSRYVTVVRDVSVQRDMDRLRDDFIATLTHDLRTPLLATIQTLSFFIDGTLGDLQDRQRRLLSTMKKSNEDILGLVNALLEVYKYESGKLNLCRTKFSLNEFLTQCRQEISPLAEKKDIMLDVTLSRTDGVVINVDKNEIKRVVFNLLGNAITHNASGTMVVVDTKIQGSDIILSVKDNGAGIPKGDIPKMFKRFSQGTSDKRSVGTGLGLYLSRQIVEAHGGKIWLETDKAKGTEFLVLLPDVVVEEDMESVALSSKKGS